MLHGLNQLKYDPNRVHKWIIWLNSHYTHTHTHEQKLKTVFIVKLNKIERKKGKNELCLYLVKLTNELKYKPMPVSKLM